MDEPLPIHDIDLIFNRCVVFYKNKPVYIEQVYPDGKVSVRDLLTQKSSNIRFDLKAFSNPVRRIGFINVNGSVLYAYRVPVRKFKAGICDVNIRINTLEVDYPFGRDQTRLRVKSLLFPELGQALINKYPTFKEALGRITTGEAAVAFDKQFAIDNRRRIWYKTQQVGNLSRSKIEFFQEYNYLKSLLGENDEGA
jgi:hypothetical protein